MNQPAPPAAAQTGTATTEILITRARADDPAAREALVARFLPMLRRWAHGRLPPRARGLSETDDLVQITLLRALNNLDAFQSRGAGSFLAYLRHILLNAVREEIRRSATRGEPVALESAGLSEDEELSPVAQLAGAERLRAYERALAALPRASQELVVMRIEFGMSFPEIEAETGIKADTVRVSVARALKRMAASVNDDGTGTKS